MPDLVTPSSAYSQSLKSGENTSMYSKNPHFDQIYKKLFTEEHPFGLPEESYEKFEALPKQKSLLF